MSTQPRKSTGRSADGVDGTESQNGSGAKPASSGPGSGSGGAQTNGGKPKKNLPTAKPVRDGAVKPDDTVEDFKGKPGSSSPTSKDGKAGTSGKAGSSSAPSGGIAPVKDGPAKPNDSTPAWAKPAEPGGSVFTDRNDSSSKPFGQHEVSGNAAAPAMSPGAPPSGPGVRPGPSGPGRTATATKEKPVAGSAAAKLGGGTKSPRKAQLQLSRLEPWSVMKFSFVMSLVCFVVLIVAVIVLYVILSGLGVFDAISSTINDLTAEQGDKSGGLDAASWFSFVRIFGYTVLVGALNVLLITALSTVGSVIYNLAADLVGGIEVTLKEAE